MAWVKPYWPGAGLLHCTLGHTSDTFKRPAMQQLMRQGTHSGPPTEPPTDARNRRAGRACLHLSPSQNTAACCSAARSGGRPTPSGWSSAGVVVLDMTDSALAVALLTFWRRAAQLVIRRLRRVSSATGWVGATHLTLSQVRHLRLLRRALSPLRRAKTERLGTLARPPSSSARPGPWTRRRASALVPDLLGEQPDRRCDAMLESFTHSILIRPRAPTLPVGCSNMFGTGGGLSALITPYRS